MKPATIKGLRVERFMRLKGCDLEFRGGALEIVGSRRNKAGKTSLTRAIEVALGGKGEEPPEVLHGDASDGSVEVYTSDDMTVRREWHRGRGGEIRRKLIVLGAPGFAPGERATGKVETLLKGLWSAAGAVKPGEFLELGKTPAGRREQGVIFRKVAGLDWEELDQEYAALYATRADVNKKVSDLRGVLGDTPTCQDAPKERVSVSELTATLRRQQEYNGQEGVLDSALRAAEQQEAAVATCKGKLDALGEAKTELADARAPIADLQQVVDDLERQLAEARGRLSDATHRRQQAINAANDAHRELREAARAANIDLATDGLETTLANLKTARTAAVLATERAKTDIAKFRKEDDLATLAEIEGAEEHNRQVDGRAKYLATRDKLEERRQEAHRLTNRLEEIQAEKARQLAEADLPEGLGFDEDGITIDGMPIENASHAQQYEAAITVAFLQAAHIGLVIVRGDYLDEEAMAVLQRRAEEKGVQVFVERVARRPEDREACTIFVEDGTAEVVV
jgi:hypothetical protein